MKHSYSLLALLLAVGLLSPPALSQIADPSAESQAPAVQPTDRLASHTQAIRDAQDPSVAVAAYARAVAEIGPDGTIPQSLLEAYVHRMVQFYLPDAAYQQARMLVDANPDDGIAWAVMSFVAARRGQMAEALADTVQAASRMPDNRFVQETAGQVLAWYDLNKPTVSDSLRSSIERIRKDLQGQQSFAQAYQDATNDLQGSGAQSAVTTRPARTPSADQQAYQVSPQEPVYGEPRPEPLYSYPDTSYLSDGYLGAYPAYPYGIYYPSMVYNAPYVAHDWWWWNSWWPYGPYWPFLGDRTVVINKFDGDRRLFRLGNLLFERRHGKFNFVGVDRNRTSTWLDRTNRASVSRDVSRRIDISRTSADRSDFVSRGSQSRIFSAGRAPDRLTFARPGGSISQGRQGAVSVNRDVWSGVPRLGAAQEAPRSATASPVAPRQRTDVSRGDGYSRSGAVRSPLLGRSGASGTSSMRGMTPAPRTISPTTPGRTGSLAPRAYSPSSPQIGRSVPSGPRMDAGRSAAPRSFAAPRSSGTGGSRGSPGISRGGFGTGGSRGPAIRSGGNIGRGAPSGASRGGGGAGRGGGGGRR
jgi:hypothetical protein